MKPDLEVLRRLAEAAAFEMPAETQCEIAALQMFRATVNPRTVLSILDRIKELEADNERMREALEQRDNDLSLVLDCFEFYRDAAGESMDPEDSETIQQINSDLILRQLDVARADRARALLEGE